SGPEHGESPSGWSSWSLTESSASSTNLLGAKSSNLMPVRDAGRRSRRSEQGRNPFFAAEQLLAVDLEPDLGRQHGMPCRGIEVAPDPLEGIGFREGRRAVRVDEIPHRAPQLTTDPRSLRPNPDAFAVGKVVTLPCGAVDSLRSIERKQARRVYLRSRFTDLD